MFQGKSPTDTHIKQVCMRVMQGKSPSDQTHTQTLTEDMLFYWKQLVG